ncbi:MAG: LysR family transcriptional regulator [Burkholderiaceae bacterium]
MKVKYDPSWDDLKILLELSRHTTFQAASKKIGVNHTTVCRRIARIEASLGLKLVDRTKNGITIRPEAAEILEHVEYMERHAQMLFQQAGTNNEGQKLVRIATMEGLASGYIAPRLALLRQSHPEIRVQLVSTPLIVDIGKREADIVVSFFNPQPKRLRSEKVAECALHLYCSSAYRKKNGLPKTEEELREHEYVGYIDELLAIDAVRWLRNLVPSPRMTFCSNSVLAQRAAAISGMGIVMLPTFVAMGSKELQAIEPDKFCVRREIWMSVGVDADYLSPIRAVTKFLIDAFEHDRDFMLGACSTKRSCVEDTP